MSPYKKDHKVNIKKKSIHTAFASWFCLSYWTLILTLILSLCCKSPRSLRQDRGVYYIGWESAAQRSARWPPAVRGQQQTWVWSWHSWKVPIDYKIYELNSFFSNDLMTSSIIKQSVIWKPAPRQTYRILSICVFSKEVLIFNLLTV